MGGEEEVWQEVMEQAEEKTTDAGVRQRQPFPEGQESGSPRKALRSKKEVSIEQQLKEAKEAQRIAEEKAMEAQRERDLCRSHREPRISLLWEHKPYPLSMR